MVEHPTFDCYLFGRQSRLIQCGQILLDKGHTILGVVTDDEWIVRWAKRASLRCIRPHPNIASELSQRPCDLAFSIDNFAILPAEVLQLPRRFAINFHDGPLPQYAGVHATSWALINGETTHGVTWHLMTSDIDGGDVLKQLSFPIDQTDSAMTLNGHCYEKSLETFASLLDELAEGRVCRTEQDLNRRTYYGRWTRPSSGATIDWTKTAAEIKNLFRGLDFGSYANPLSLPKIVASGQTVVVTECAVLETHSTARPGTIMRITPQHASIATVDHDVSLGGFLSWRGEAISPAEFLQRAGCCEGDLLPRFDDRQAAHVTRLHEGFARHEASWVERLIKHESIEIPFCNRPSRTHRPDRTSLLSVEVPSELADICPSVPASIVTLAAVALYVSRIADTSNLTIDFRSSSLQEKVAGCESFFATQVPLNVEIDDSIDFSTFCQYASSEIESVLRQGTFARDLVLREPRLRKALRRAHEDSIALVIELEEASRDGGDQIAQGSPLPERSDLVDADLTIRVALAGTKVHWFFKDRAFERSNMHKMQQQFVTLLQDIVSRAKAPVGRLSILSATDSRSIFHEWNPERDFSQSMCLHERFEQQVARSPQGVALVLGNERMTYAQLNRGANRLAHRLSQEGVGPETLVALCVERDFNLIVGILGILKAGGAYLPLDPTYPADRLRFMVEDAQATLIVSQTQLQDRLPPICDRRIFLDELEDISDEKDKHLTRNGITRARPNSLAYVIYTSGSTGRPKGVQVTHHNVTRLFAATDAWFQFAASDVWTLFHSYAFDFSVWEIWGALLYGGRLVIIPYAVTRSPNDFRQLLADQGVTVLNQTPSAFRQLVHAETSAGPKVDLGLRYVIFGGEALEPQSVRQWIVRHGDDAPQLINMYGITETTVHVTYSRITAADVQNDSTTVIGVPIPDLRVYVLDRNGQPLPIGALGELYVGGAGVSRGYLNRPELTTKQFVADQFSNRPNARLYRTGDLGRYRADGRIEYLGRNDQQIQIRGFRVELAEIESAILDHESVSQTIVIVQEPEARDQRLMAYIVLQPGDSPSVVELREHLQSRLPDYMIPQHFVKIDDIPLTANGKLDREALPNPVAIGPASDHVEPGSDLEQQIAKMWSDILGVDRVSATATFLESGGHSLLFVRLLDVLKQRLAEANALSMVDLFRYPSVSDLAGFLEQGQTMTPRVDLVQALAEQQKAALRQQRLRQAHRSPSR